MEFSIENLEEAVSLFYRSEAPQQGEAHRWLQEAQISPHAWSFVWELLRPEKHSEVQFFAATTLHNKLLKFWHEVPEDHYEILKKKLLESIINFARGPKLVLNRLCIALSAYVIHTHPKYWPNAFEELVASFQPHNLPHVEAERVIWILLEILTVIPEEFNSMIMGVTQRNDVKAALIVASKDIFRFIEMCLLPIPTNGFEISNLTTYYNASRCASAWMQLTGLSIDQYTSLICILIDLCSFVYWNRQDPDEVGSDELEVMEVSIEALHSVVQNPQNCKYENHLVKITAKILYEFEKILDIELTSGDMNTDVIDNLYGLIITVSDTHSKIFIDNLQSQDPGLKQLSFDLFTSILKCTNLPGRYPVDESTSMVTFSFWYTLQDEILNLEAARCAQLLLMVKPFYRDLVVIMLRKSMFPLVPDEGWTSEDREVFRCYRQDVSDTFTYCFNVLNLEMLDILSSRLLEALHKDNDNDTPIQWNEIETCLHAFCAVAESVEMENLYLPNFMHIIKDIPFAELNSKVLNTALDTIGAYSEWFLEHPELLQKVFPLVISSIGNAESTTNATMALKELTHFCQRFLLPYADHMLVTVQTVLQSGVLKLAEHRRLMNCVGRILSFLPVNKFMNYLNVLLAPTFEEIQKLVNLEPSSSCAASIATRLKILSALFSSLHVETLEPEEQQPTLLIIQNTMELYKMIGHKYSNSQEVMEDLSCLLKYAVTTLKDDCKPIINDILNIIVTTYRLYPQPHVLILAKTIIILFGKDEEFVSINQQLLQEIIFITLQMCSQLSATNQLAEKTDVLEGFFLMLAAFAKKVPLLVFSPNIDSCSLFQCAILCLSLPELQTLKACSNFLVHFITQSRETAHADIIQNYGESLVLRILVTLGNSAPRSSMETFSEILLALNKKYCDNLSRWLNTLLAQEGFPTLRITKQQKETFIKQVLREKANKKKLCDSVLEFTLICKGILKVDNTLP